VTAYSIVADMVHCIRYWSSKQKAVVSISAIILFGKKLSGEGCTADINIAIHSQPRMCPHSRVNRDAALTDG